MKKIIKNMVMYITLVLVSVIGLLAVKNKSYAAETTDTDKFLFIGNSLTYYNNLPEQFKNFAFYGAGKNIRYSTCTYGGRSLKEHAKAISIVVRCEGDVTKITEEEKECFKVHSVTESGQKQYAYNKVVFERYCDAIWDYNTNSVKRYNHIVLQTFYNAGNPSGDVDSVETAEAIRIIIACLGDSNTSFIVRSSISRWKDSLEVFVSEQTVIDGIITDAIEQVNNNRTEDLHYNKLYCSYEGRAFCNYLLYAGTHKASAQDQYMYSVYSRVGGKLGYVNDLLYGDKVHMTFLGTYLATACLYEVYNNNECHGFDSRYVVSRYHGATTSRIININKMNEQNGILGANYGFFFNNKKGISSSKICYMAAFIANQTNSGNMIFTNVEQANEWKNMTTVQNYDYGNINYYVVQARANVGGPSLGSMILCEDSVSNTVVFSTSRVGYRLIGWSKKYNSATAEYPLNYNFSNSEIKSNLGKFCIVYPVWKRNTLTLEYNNNIGSGTMIKKVVYTYGVSAKMLPRLSRKGYVHVGWAFAKDGTTKIHKPGETVSNNMINHLANKKYNIYAIWKPDRTTFVYNNSIGRGTNIKTVTYTYGKAGNTFLPKLSRKGYVFRGWCFTKNASTAVYRAGATVTDKLIYTFLGNIKTLYAIWEKA